jgi:hypothetical protein
MPISYFSGDQRKTLTAALTTDDAGAPIFLDPILFGDVNIHVYGGDVYYGDAEHVLQAVQSSATPTCSIARANSVMWFQKLLLNEVWFKSYVNATPGYVVITGTLIG